MDFSRVMRNDFDLVVAGINGGLENLHFQLSDLGPAQATDQLFGLTRKHRAANHFDAAATLMGMKSIFEKHKIFL